MFADLCLPKPNNDSSSCSYGTLSSSQGVPKVIAHPAYYEEFLKRFWNVLRPIQDLSTNPRTRYERLILTAAFPKSLIRCSPANTRHLYNICTTSAQRLRRWSNIVQKLYKCFVLAGSYWSMWQGVYLPLCPGKWCSLSTLDQCCYCGTRCRSHHMIYWHNLQKKGQYKRSESPTIHKSE